MSEYLFIDNNLHDIPRFHLPSQAIDREPIHMPSAIQAHGMLLTCSETDLTILQISQNCQALLGQQPATLLGQPLSLLMGETQFAAIQSCLNGDFENVNPLRLVLQIQGKSEVFEGVVHRADGVIVIELELCATAAREDLPISNLQAVNFFDFYKFVKTPIDRIQSTQTLAELADRTVTAIRSLTGFDRVMLYRLDEDGSGHVIAENKIDGSALFWVYTTQRAISPSKPKNSIGSTYSELSQMCATSQSYSNQLSTQSLANHWI